MEAYGATRKTAEKCSSRVRNNPEVKKYIAEAVGEISKNAKLDAEKVLCFLCSVAFTSPADFAKIKVEGGKQKIVWKDVNKLPEEIKCAIATIKNTPSGIVIETLDRLKAVDLLMKYMGIDKNQSGGVYFEGENEIEE